MRFENDDVQHAAFADTVKQVQEKTKRLLNVNGTRSVDDFHRELGQLMWNHCGMSRTADGLREVLKTVPELRERFWRDVRVLGNGEDFNQSLEKAGRVADFLEFAELMARDALERHESCGGHFREEHATSDGEALRDDENFAHVSAWEFTGVGEDPVLHREQLEFEYVHLTQRSYK